MDLFNLVKEKAPDIIRIAESHGAANVRLFGSVARLQAQEDSDCDFLVSYIPGKRSSWFPIGLIQDLETLLGKKVDIITEKSLTRLKDNVLREAIPLCDLIDNV